MNAILAHKWQDLVARLGRMESVIVAYSGGVDSGLLAAAAYEALGDNMLAVTIHSPVDPAGEQEAAASLAAQVGFAHRVVEMNDLENPLFTANPPDRCYHCKRARLAALQQMGKELGYAVTVEGSNQDDEKDYRPGKRAVEELGIRSPLAEAGFRKAQIREIAREKGLVVWDRPSAPCLATRFPYGSEITHRAIDQVREAEAYLAGLGFQPVRVRHEGAAVRIEVDPTEIARLAGSRELVVIMMKELGFQYIALDLEGYRSGSLNEVLQ